MLSLNILIKQSILLLLANNSYSMV